MASGIIINGYPAGGSGAAVSPLTGLNGQTITGDVNGAWAIAANGTNQSVALAPSGTGNVSAVSGNFTLSNSGLVSWPGLGNSIGAGGGGTTVFVGHPSPSTTESYGLGVAANRWSGLFLGQTVTAAGTTGAQTINKASGRVNFAAAATSLVVTNSLVTASSVIIATVQSNDTTMKSVQAVAAAGSFTLYANAAATAETKVGFFVLN